MRTHPQNAEIGGATEDQPKHVLKDDRILLLHLEQGILQIRDHASIATARIASGDRVTVADKAGRVELGN